MPRMNLASLLLGASCTFHAHGYDSPAISARRKAPASGEGLSYLNVNHNGVFDRASRHKVGRPIAVSSTIQQDVHVGSMSRINQSAEEVRMSCANKKCCEKLRGLLDYADGSVPQSGMIRSCVDFVIGLADAHEIAEPSDAKMNKLIKLLDDPLEDPSKRIVALFGLHAISLDRDLPELKQKARDSCLKFLEKMKLTDVIEKAPVFLKEKMKQLIDLLNDSEKGFPKRIGAFCELDAMKVQNADPELQEKLVAEKKDATENCVNFLEKWSLEKLNEAVKRAKKEAGEEFYDAPFSSSEEFEAIKKRANAVTVLEEKWKQLFKLLNDEAADVCKRLDVCQQCCDMRPQEVYKEQALAFADVVLYIQESSVTDSTGEHSTNSMDAGRFSETEVVRAAALNTILSSNVWAINAAVDRFRSVAYDPDRAFDRNFVHPNHPSVTPQVVSERARLALRALVKVVESRDTVAKNAQYQVVINRKKAEGEKRMTQRALRSPELS